MNRVARTLRHIAHGDWTVRRHFPHASLDRIEASVGTGETTHGAEVRVAIEASLDPWQVAVDALTPRERAMQVFGELGVWDTERNNGILVYLLLADRAVEIVADRDADKRLGPPVWEEACAIIHRAFSDGRFEEGLLRALEFLTQRLAQVYPLAPGDRNELPDRPVVL